ncbi:DUF1992 domain-containing protein [Streptomyces sp. 3MP-14]|uniref:DUF1992 domain-containing protein n=1 Tax=Streptomyces mimosae TaxID=2586635 RepID=A0A5N6AQN7_9ACTN|nr:MULTISPECIES: DUF1992 domain-containing protein [Streptomyces]KAB8170924.1 DUF1992 domain-containing protein [Streptomyces mimosae]KAB8179725.1 DUF1992 domain-containing protein [Streptomyces sp. 3MP-14]
MTERKPAGLSFESWVDKQIREAEERGAFRDLPGAGKPLPHASQPYDELWWVREKMAREHLSALPPSLALRREAEDAHAAALAAPTERAVRRILAEINERIRRGLRGPLEGPPLNLVPFDEEAVVAEWRAAVAARLRENASPRSAGNGRG